MSNEIKQSAVDWQFDQLSSENLLGIFTHDQQTRVMEILVQAKEMEKEQKANTWNNAINAFEKDKWESFEQYYNETYGGNNLCG
jgi:hypothetical protein